MNRSLGVYIIERDHFLVFKDYTCRDFFVYDLTENTVFHLRPSSPIPLFFQYGLRET